MKKLLEVQNIAKYYSGKPVVNDLSFDIGFGEILGLIGPNGAGKTTAFYITIGLVAPDAGAIYFKGQNVTKMPIHKRAKLGFGYLSQEPSVFQSLSVEDNILCILETLPIKDRKERLEELLSELDLAPLRRQKAITLSGGQRRRLEITRSLATEPALLLLDEPFANIDPLAIADVKKLIRHLKKKGISVLITDHNAREIFSIVDRCYLMQDGKVLLQGSTEELIRHPQAISTYLGEGFQQ